MCARGHQLLKQERAKKQGDEVRFYHVGGMANCGSKAVLDTGAMAYLLSPLSDDEETRRCMGHIVGVGVGCRVLPRRGS